jgi:hypothetical protein
MNAESAPRSRAEVVDEVSKWSVGSGVILVALFPLSLPFLILTLVAVLPLVVPLLAVGLVAGAVAVPVMLLWKLGHSVTGIRSRRRRERSAESAPHPATGR